MKKEREQRISYAEEDWLLELISILERIYWESSKLPLHTKLNNRSIPTPASEYGESNDLEHLDDLMEELMDHFSHAPPEVTRKLRGEVFELKKAYDNPDLNGAFTTSYFRTEF